VTLLCKPAMTAGKWQYLDEKSSSTRE